MSLTDFIKAMPKIELHVHLQGATQPDTLLKLAELNQVDLPVKTLEDVRNWYQFTDFQNFIDIYVQVCRVIVSDDDLEVMTWEFLKNQAAQNIVYSEVTYTPAVRNHMEGLTFDKQLAAINRAIRRAEEELGVSMALVIDIPRVISSEQADLFVEWAIYGYGKGVVAFGLGGYEPGNPPENYARQFKRIKAAGIPIVPHAGEKVGPESIWSALKVCDAVRIGHGVRCIEDAELVAVLRDTRIPLEVSPTSNVLLGVCGSIAEHPINRLIEAGLIITVNSDDPPMFNTSLTNEFLVCAQTFGWSADLIEQLTMNALKVSFLPQKGKQMLQANFEQQFADLRERYIVPE